LCLAQQPNDADRAYFQQQSNQVSSLFRSKEIGKAVTILEELRRDPRLAQFDGIRIDALYNSSCGYSLLGRNDEAVACLRDADSAGYNDYRRIQQDTDFDNIHTARAYLKIIA